MAQEENIGESNEKSYKKTLKHTENGKNKTCNNSTQHKVLTDKKNADASLIPSIVQSLVVRDDNASLTNAQNKFQYVHSPIDSKKFDTAPLSIEESTSSQKIEDISLEAKPHSLNCYTGRYFKYCVCVFFQLQNFICFELSLAIQLLLF